MAGPAQEGEVIQTKRNRGESGQVRSRDEAPGERAVWAGGGKSCRWSHSEEKVLYWCGIGQGWDLSFNSAGSTTFLALDNGSLVLRHGVLTGKQSLNNLRGPF